MVCECMGACDTYVADGELAAGVLQGALGHERMLQDLWKTTTTTAILTTDITHNILDYIV